MHRTLSAVRERSSAVVSNQQNPMQVGANGAAWRLLPDVQRIPSIPSMWTSADQYRGTLQIGPHPSDQYRGTMQMNPRPSVSAGYGSSVSGACAHAVSDSGLEGEPQAFQEQATPADTVALRRAVNQRCALVGFPDPLHLCY
jgi:hypothetical protein